MHQQVNTDMKIRLFFPRSFLFETQILPVRYRFIIVHLTITFKLMNSVVNSGQDQKSKSEEHKFSFSDSVLLLMIHYFLLKFLSFNFARRLFDVNNLHHVAQIYFRRSRGIGALELEQGSLFLSLKLH